MSEPTLYLVGCVITDDAGRILMLHRNREVHPQWELPGGRVDPSEDPRAAVAHKVKKELGLGVEVRHQLGEHFMQEDGQTIHYVWFATQLTDGQPQNAEPKLYDQMVYMSRGELGQLEHQLSSSTRHFLKVVEA